MTNWQWFALIVAIATVVLAAVMTTKEQRKDDSDE